jgi:CheY-like chemotaxis protein
VPELSSTAVLLLPTIPESASAEPTAAIDLGWVSLVPKPFTEQQLTSAVARAADSRDDADGEQEEPKARPCEVLVVDDDPESRHVARTFLVRAGLHVREATDGESALVAMRFRRPGVVVLDLMMPVIDGFGVLAAMRADTHLSGVPVVVLSAKTLTAAERAFLGRSAVRVLQKGEHRLSDVAALVLRAAGGRRT